MSNKTKRQARRQGKTQKASAQAREKATPPHAVVIVALDEDGRRLDAVCFPPEPVWINHRGRHRQRFHTQRRSQPLAERYARLEL